ncbi:MAG: dehydratase [Solirubrobacterales bacterium]|nr:dehydratase [Solirubrobacterales bacterium]
MSEDASRGERAAHNGARPSAPEVGAETLSAGRTITEADVVSFAALTGDWHPQHADADWAARSRFGERVAHGMLVLSFAVGLVDFDPERVVALRGLDSATFKRPVRIGDTIHVRSRVDDVRPVDDEHLLIRFAWRVTNQEQKLVVRARVEALWRLPVAAASERAAQAGEVDDPRADAVLL